MKAHRILICLSLLGALPARADLQVYELPSGVSMEVGRAIQHVLPALCQNLEVHCQASELPNGQVLVEAPSAVHQQISAVIRQIRANQGGPTPRLTLHYWMLAAVRGAPDASDSALTPLRPVMAELERQNGELGFALVDTVTITSDSGKTSRVNGNAGPSDRTYASRWIIRQLASSNGDRLTASVQSDFNNTGTGEGSTYYAHEIAADITLDRGEFLVLSETSTPGSGDETLYYLIVHWPDSE